MIDFNVSYTVLTGVKRYRERESCASNLTRVERFGAYMMALYNAGKMYGHLEYRSSIQERALIFIAIVIILH